MEDYNVVEKVVFQATYYLAEIILKFLSSMNLYIEIDTIQAILTIIGFLIIGIVMFSIFGIISTAKSKKYAKGKKDRCTSETIGEVIDIVSERHYKRNDSGGHTSYYVTRAVVKYNYSYTMKISDVLTRDYKVGDHLTILFNPNNPEDAIALRDLKDIDSKHTILTPIKDVLSTFLVFIVMVCIFIFFVEFL